MNLEEVAEKTYRLGVEIPELDINFAVYFIHESGGVIIEPGPTAIIPSIQEAMKQLGMNSPAYIIPTHIHLEHGGAIGSLARLFPGSKVVLHPVGVKHSIEPSRLIRSTKMAFGDDFEAHYGPILPVPESQVVSAEDGEIVSIGNRELQIIHAPGHAPHHIAILTDRQKGFFLGKP